MNPQEQIVFVEELIEHVREDIQKEIIKRSKDISGWDGYELRQYIADKFSEARYNPMTGKRLKEYKNTVLVNGM